MSVYTDCLLNKLYSLNIHSYWTLPYHVNHSQVCSLSLSLLISNMLAVIRLWFGGLTAISHVIILEFFVAGRGHRKKNESARRRGGGDCDCTDYVSLCT